MPLVDTVVHMKNKPRRCDILHHGECSCWLGHLYNQSKYAQEQYHRIQIEMQKMEEEVVNLKEFRNLNEFAAVFQPWPMGLNVCI